MFERRVKIRFAHCDPAGIIFYPRYFEIVNQIVEDWFAEFLECSFAQFKNLYGLGTPMVDIQTQFKKPCRLDDEVIAKFLLENMGRTSASFCLHCFVNDELSIVTQGTIVCSDIGLSGSKLWPIPIKRKMERFTKLSETTPKNI